MSKYSGTIWVAAVLILTAGYQGVVARCEGEIKAAQDRTKALYRLTLSNERLVRQAEALRATQSAVEADLRRISTDGNLPFATVGLLNVLATSAQRFHARVISIEPAPAPPAQAGQDADLRQTPLTLRIRGGFADILRFEEGLPRHRTLMSVAGTQLAIAPAENAPSTRIPQIDATIHVTVYRVHLPRADEEPISARERSL